MTWEHGVVHSNRKWIGHEAVGLLAPSRVAVPVRVASWSGHEECFDARRDPAPDRASLQQGVSASSSPAGSRAWSSDKPASRRRRWLAPLCDGHSPSLSCGLAVFTVSASSRTASVIGPCVNFSRVGWRGIRSRASRITVVAMAADEYIADETGSGDTELPDQGSRRLAGVGQCVSLPSTASTVVVFGLSRCSTAMRVRGVKKTLKSRGVGTAIRERTGLLPTTAGEKTHEQRKRSARQIERRRISTPPSSSPSLQLGSPS